MAMVTTAALPRQPHRDGQFDAAYEGFIQTLQMVKKIINLMKAFILFYSLPPPTLTAPRTIKYRPPCVPRRSHVLYYPSPVTLALFGWLLCAIIDWRPLN